MAEEIFTPEELAAEAERPNDAPEQPQERQDDRPRDEHGRFAPKQEEGQQPEAEQRDDKGNLVPQGALHAERERRKAAEGRAQESESRWKQAQDALDAIARMREQVQGRQPQADPDAPKPEADPGAKIDYLTKRLEELSGNQDSIVRSQQDQRLQQAEHQQLSAALTTSEAEFRQKTPDYDDAVNHLVTARAQELGLYGLSPVEIQQTLQQEVLDITRAAISQGRAPAEVGYQLAKLRGYRAEAGGEQQQQPNPAAATIQAIQRAQTGSRSLGQAAGAASPKDLNAQTIAAMNDDEFQALYSTPEGRRMIDAL